MSERERERERKFKSKNIKIIILGRSERAERIGKNKIIFFGFQFFPKHTVRKYTQKKTYIIFGVFFFASKFIWFFPLLSLALFSILLHFYFFFFSFSLMCVDACGGRGFIVFTHSTSSSTGVKRTGERTYFAQL